MERAEIKREEVYAVDGALLQAVRDIMSRLYNDRPIEPDERRDMANRLDAVLEYIQIADYSLPSVQWDECGLSSPLTSVSD